MKRLNILRFFSKKGVFWIGIIVGICFSCLYPVLKANAAYVNEYTPTGSTCLLLSYTDDKGHVHEVYAEFPYVDGVPNNGDIRIAFHPGRNRPVLSNYEYKYYDSGIHERADGTYNYQVSDMTGTGLISNVRSDAKLYIPVFSDYEKFQGYINGTVDISECDNYADIKAQEESISGIDDSFPYFDQSVMKLNQNDSVTYQSSMSADMQDQFYQMCAKIPDKNNSAVDTEHYKAYVEMSASALYASNEALGLFNSTALKLAGTTVPGGTDKLDEIIQFDSNGRIKVSGYSSTNSTVASALGGSMAGQLVNSMFNIDSTSPLVAVAVDDITLSDKNSSFPGVVRNLSAASAINESSSISIYTVLENMLIGSVATGTGYTLVGYVADVRVVYYEVATGKYIASRDSYTYTWTYTTLQNRYGSGTVSYDSQGNIIGKTEFDNITTDVGYQWGPGYSDLDEDEVMKRISSGFGLLGKSGMLALSQRVFVGLPVWVWTLIGMLISVNIIVIVFKVVRGM